MLNQFDPAIRPLLEGIQGNILKSHGRHHTANVFIECQAGEPAEARQWLHSLVDHEHGIVQSAYTQLRQNVLFKESERKLDTGLFACIHISANGYRYLFGDDARFNLFEAPFKKGMKQANLGDPPLASWESGFQPDSHFMLLLAHANPTGLEGAIEEIQQQVQFFARINSIERGIARFNKAEAGIEHFGYVDGVSQPLFFADEWDAYKANNGIRNEKSDVRFDPRAAPTQVLLHDPFISEQDKTAQGSYFVFRKLEQNVKGFKVAELALAEHDLGLEGEDAERAGAMLVGRWEDGSPVELSGEEGLVHNSVYNNFGYDPANNSRCPFHGHIRKTNPRFGPVKENKQADANHMMARRGIPYGNRTDDPNDGHIYNKPEKGVGLLFMSYQASIANQFEFIQKNWANNPTFPNFNPGKPDGLDPIIGQGEGTRKGAFAQTWGDANSMREGSFEQFVTMKGGEYFFAPSMAFLREIQKIEF